MQWKPVNTTTFEPWKSGRIKGVVVFIGSHYGATGFKHVLHMNTFLIPL